MREMTKRYFPEMPPMLDGETAEQYTDRLTGADGTARVPYDHRRYRQCSLGYHDECSDPAGDICECPCHRTALPAVQEVEKKERVYQGGTWNNWIAPFHLCAYCSESLNWEKTVDVLDRPWITAKCACGIIYSARLSADDLARARAVDDGNKLAASILSGLAPTPPAVTAEALAWVRSHAEANTHPTIRARAAEILAALTAPQDATPASKGDDNG